MRAGSGLVRWVQQPKEGSLGRRRPVSSKETTMAPPVRAFTYSLEVESPSRRGHWNPVWAGTQSLFRDRRAMFTPDLYEEPASE
jgi:hypothetical protein